MWRTIDSHARDQTHTGLCPFRNGRGPLVLEYGFFHAEKFGFDEIARSADRNWLARKASDAVGAASENTPNKIIRITAFDKENICCCLLVFIRKTGTASMATAVIGCGCDPGLDCLPSIGLLWATSLAAIADGIDSEGYARRLRNLLMERIAPLLPVLDRTNRFGLKKLI